MIRSKEGVAEKNFLHIVEKWQVVDEIDRASAENHLLNRFGSLHNAWQCMNECHVYMHNKEMSMDTFLQMLQWNIDREEKQ